MFTLFDLVILSILAGAPAWWWYRSGTKQKVLAFVRKYCEARGLQLLDQTLAFRHYRLDRTNRKLKILSIYEFDFSTDGENRFHGEVSLRGRRLSRIVLEGDTLEVTEY